MHPKDENTLRLDLMKAERDRLHVTTVRTDVLRELVKAYDEAKEREVLAAAAAKVG